MVRSGGTWLNPITDTLEPKLHLHWRLSQPASTAADREALRTARKFAATLVYADTTNISIVHPIRWPGSWHKKTVPALSVIEAEHDVEVDLEAACEALRDALGPERLAALDRPPPAPDSDDDGTANPQDVAAAVSILPNDGRTWEDWDSIGRAIWRSTSGTEYGFQIFDAFSRKAESLYDPDETRARWDHWPHSPPTATGANKLFALAREVDEGWQPPSATARVEEAAAGFDVLPVPASPVGRRPRLHYVLMRDVAPRLDRIALVDRWLDRGVMSVLYGDSNVGKTFVALAISRCIAAGEPVAGRRVQQGGVVYVAAEAGTSIERRVEALRRHYGRGDLPLAVVPCPVDLLSPDGDAAALAQLVREAGSAMGCGVALIVVDTLSRAMQGGNENASEDMGRFVINTDRLRIATGGHVMIVHHSGKDRAKGARGHSLLRAATDTEIEVEAGLVKATKQRDLELPQPMPFRLQSVEIGRDNEGETVTSAVALLGERPPATINFDVLKLTKMEAIALDTLSEAIATRGVKVGDEVAATISDWSEVFFLRLNATQNGLETSYGRAGSASVLRTHKNALRKKNVIREIIDKHWVLDTP